GTVDEDFHGMRKGPAFLHEVIAQKPETTALREDGSFIVERAVPEVEYQLEGHSPAMDDLEHVSVGDGRSRKRAQGETAVSQSLRIPDGYLLRRQDA
ncbi:MAG TPA: hypothetical protein VGV68_16460, partial [Terriglobia bacterium]|nr:hypothetical protein [Terriglobia bacterium]